MSSPAFETFFAQLLIDPAFRAEFLADRPGAARRAGLTPEEITALSDIDAVGLELAVRSLIEKRRQGG